MFEYYSFMGKNKLMYSYQETAFFRGKLIESGKDILVLSDGERFVYIPLLHVHRINLSPIINDHLSDPTETSLAKDVKKPFLIVQF
ncbi:hypothetical protein GCM10020331_006470 [Ectobacillus funiculus]